eukprot:comp22804_c0_seq1/m.35782 comp22804_c0_seq1/g.35782  ORF comp22804_c0_seq1/g.35782 comp22804_c0_seq1/m.35782 type:complete len:214 (-) comp22804_c0_seq1:313-954(-)
MSSGESGFTGGKPATGRIQPRIRPSPQLAKRGATKPSIDNTANLPADTAPSKLPGNLRQLARPHPLKILLVEDNPVNQKVTGKFLKELGYHYDICNNGVEVIELLRKQEFRQDYDVILMDLHMPEMDGHETTKRIRVMFPPEEQPTIVALTASEEVADTMQCLAHGIEHYLAKPINCMDIAQVLFKCRPIRVRAPVQPVSPTPMPKLSRKNSV